MIFLSLMFIIVALALPNLKTGFGPLLMIRITSLVFLFSAFLSFNIFYISNIKSGIGIYSGLFHVSTVSQLSETFLLVVAFLILLAMRPSETEKNKNKMQLSSKAYKNNEINYFSEYSLIVLFSTLGTTLLISCYDLISLYLSIELQSFGVYILTTLYRNSEKASNAGLMYFLLGGLSSCLILLGSGLIYSFTGLTNLESIYSLISVYDNSTQGFTLGIVLIIIGLLFKIAAAPFHNWSPSVYDNSPTIVTIWLTIMPKIGILIFLLDFVTQSNTSIVFGEVGLLSYNSIENLYFINFKDSIKGILLVSSALSLIIGTVVGLAQTKIKRLLAYSTISHIGFILLSLAINTEQSIEALIFYIVQYTISNLTIFLVIIGLGYLINNNMNKNSNFNSNSEKDIEFIAEIKGQFFSNPILSLSLTICLFSMAGVPPLIGFFGKQFVLYSAVQSGYYFISILAIFVSVISASYYLKLIRLLHSDSENTENLGYKVENTSSNAGLRLASGGNETQISNFHSFTISILTLTILFFVLKPSILINSTQLLSLSLFYF
jgi:NADH-ubiquinone oxidoreductase chain 2